MIEITRSQRRPQATIEHYRAAIANKISAMVAAYATGDYTMQEIAARFSV